MHHNGEEWSLFPHHDETKLTSSMGRLFYWKKSGTKVECLAVAFGMKFVREQYFSLFPQLINWQEKKKRRKKHEIFISSQSSLITKVKEFPNKSVI